MWSVSDDICVYVLFCRIIRMLVPKKKYQMLAVECCLAPVMPVLNMGGKG